MAIENRNLEPGTVLTARYKKEERTCEVVQTDDGLRYKLDSGELFTSPSSAGKAAMAGVACNGWRFWTVQGTETPKRESKATSEPKPKAEKEPKVEKPAKAPATKKVANKSKTAKKPAAKAMRAKDVPSYGCGVCGATFGSQKAAIAHAMTHTS